MTKTALVPGPQRLIGKITMSVFKINRKSTNLELVSKLMNSVAVKYNCRVRYNPETETVCFNGNDACRSFIAEETLNLFSGARIGG